MQVYTPRTLHQMSAVPESESRLDSFVGGALITLIVLMIIITVAQF